MLAASVEPSISKCGDHFSHTCSCISPRSPASKQLFLHSVPLSAGVPGRYMLDILGTIFTLAPIFTPFPRDIERNFIHTLLQASTRFSVCGSSKNQPHLPISSGHNPLGVHGDTTFSESFNVFSISHVAWAPYFTCMFLKTSPRSTELVVVDLRSVLPVSGGLLSDKPEVDSVGT